MRVARRELAEDFFRPVWWQKWKALGHLLVLGLAVAAAASYGGPAALAVKALLVVVAALQIIGLFSLLHEAGHGHLHADRRTNDLIGEALAAVVMTSFQGYRACHLRHHAAFRSAEDPQEVIHLARRPAARAALLLFVAVAGAPIFLLIRGPVTAWRSGRRWAAVRGPLAGVSAYAALIAVTPPAVGSVVFAVIATTIVLGSLNDIVYHQGLAEDDSLAACSSLDSDGFGQLFLCGANRHAEHHVYPGVPGPHLVAVSRLVRADLEAAGAVYDHSFTVAFFRRLFGAPLFLPKAPAAPKTASAAHR